MEKLIAITVFIILFVSGLAHADRRQLTSLEQSIFTPIVHGWLASNWDKVKIYEDGDIRKQAINKVEVCCVDEDGNRQIYIVDIYFHTKLYHKHSVIEDMDMTQRVLFKLKNGEIAESDPMPPCHVEEVT